MEKCLVAKYGKKWRDLVNVRIIPPAPFVKAAAIAKEALKYEVPIIYLVPGPGKSMEEHSRLFRGYPMFIRRAKGGKREIVAKSETKTYLVPAEVIEYEKKWTRGFAQDLKKALKKLAEQRSRYRGQIKVAERLEKSDAAANPGAEYYIYPRSGGAFGPFKGKGGIRAAEIAATYYLINHPGEGWTEIRQRTPKGDVVTALVDLKSTHPVFN